MMQDWARDAVFYHIYPLGLCGTPQRNTFEAPVQPRLAQLSGWVEHMRSLGVTALYLGPLFESTSHGYDTADYYRVDRRLGTNRTLTEMVALLRANGIRVLLDGVFHHVGRDFWAFRDVQSNGAQSAYCGWFSGLDFGRRSPYGDPFAYDGWNDHYDLVKLNLDHPDVRTHLFGAVQQWITEFGIDGLRLDVADALDPAFLRDLASLCRSQRPDFWLLGEAIHGDYRRWANPEMLDSVTNYECYKSLYSSHNDHNYFEIAYALNRQFGPQGIYRDLPLYTFADNHDVSRIASTLHNPHQLYPLHALLFTMPGVPSIYYGSEWGMIGAKQHGDDWPLRPPLADPSIGLSMAHPDLAQAIARFAQIRHQTAALRRGSYQQLFVANEQIAFARRFEHELAIVLVNGATNAARFKLDMAEPDGATFIDLLDPRVSFTVQHGRLEIDPVPACWARILVRR